MDDQFGRNTNPGTRIEAVIVFLDTTNPKLTEEMIMKSLSYTTGIHSVEIPSLQKRWVKGYLVDHETEEIKPKKRRWWNLCR